MYLWFAYVVWLLSAYLMALYFSMLFPVRLKKVPKSLYPALLTVLVMGPAYIRALYSADTSSAIYQITNFIQIILILVFLIIMYDTKMWKKVMAYLLMGVMVCLSEMLTNVLVHWVGVPYDMTFNHPTMMLYLAFGNAMVFILLLPVIFIWKKCIGEKMRVNYIGFFIILPLAQWLQLLPSANKLCDFDYMINLGCYIGFLLCIFSDFILFYILMNQSEKEQLERQLSEREQLRALEAVRYEELEAKREALAKFRHDYNNWLTTALLLEEQGNIEMAKEMIGRLKEQVRT